MRLIDADALLEDVRKNSESYFADDFAKYWVDKQPTIHPDPCSVCKWADEHPWSVCEGCKAEGVSE